MRSSPHGCGGSGFWAGGPRTIRGLGQPRPRWGSGSGSPGVARVAVIFNPEIAPTGPIYIASIEAAAPALAVQAIIKMPVRNAVDIVHGIDAFATEPSSGLLMLPPPNARNVETIIQLAAQHR